MAKLYNLARVSTATTGTGTITLGAAISGFLTFAAAGVQNGDVVSYAIQDGANSEIGYGTYTASGTTLTRTVLTSTNSNNALNLSGNAFVLITASNVDVTNHTAYPNRLRNSGMDIWQRGTPVTATTAGGYTADGWIVTPTGASVSVSKSAGRLLTVNSLRITGATSVTGVTLTQRIESFVAAAMTSQQVTFQAWVYNNTGGSITPTLYAGHPNAADNYSGSTVDVNGVSLQACPNGAWTQVSYTFTASSSSAYGMYITLNFGNNFSTGAKYVQVTECDLRVTPYVPSGLNYAPPTPQFRPVHEELLFCQRYYWQMQSAYYNATYAGFIGASSAVLIRHPVTMRAAPTAGTTFEGTSNCTPSLQQVNAYDFQFNIAATATGNVWAGYSASNTITAEL